jgi:hypothetical protein
VDWSTVIALTIEDKGCEEAHKKRGIGEAGALRMPEKPAKVDARYGKPAKPTVDEDLIGPAHGHG